MSRRHRFPQTTLERCLTVQSRKPYPAVLQGPFSPRGRRSFIDALHPGSQLSGTIKKMSRLIGLVGHRFPHRRVSSSLRKSGETDRKLGRGMVADLDSLWDYEHRGPTEKKFRELLPAGLDWLDISYLAELLRRVGRAERMRK